VADSGRLLRELASMGILRDDPRLATLIETLKGVPQSCSGIDNIKLDYQLFSKLIQQSKSLISKTFKGGLVIPEFPAFTEDMVQMYERCLANRSGKPADCIPQLARIDPSKWGVSLCTTDGQRFNIGDVKEEFSIQSARWAVGFLICGCRILNHKIVVCFSVQLSCQPCND